MPLLMGLCRCPACNTAFKCVPAPFQWEYGGNMEKVKKQGSWKRKAELGGAFELVDSVNEYARQRNSVLARLAE